MSTTTTRTNMEVRVNTQDIRKADKAIRQAFDPRTVKQLHSAVAQMTKAVEKMVRATGSLTTAIKASADAGKGYQRLASDLRAARNEAEQLSRQLDRVRGGTPGGGFAGGFGGGFAGGRAGGGGGFFGGGPQQYTSGAPGAAMGPSPQIPIPSMQGAATALGALPYVGLVGAGGLMASASYYGRAMADARSRRDTFAFLGGTARAKLGIRGALSAASGAKADVSAEQAKSAAKVEALEFEAGLKRIEIGKRIAASEGLPTTGMGGFPSADARLNAEVYGALPPYEDTSRGRTHWGDAGGGGVQPYDRSGRLRPEFRGAYAPTEAARGERRRFEQYTAAANAQARQDARRAALAPFYGAGGAGSTDILNMGATFGVMPDQARQEAAGLSRGAGFRVSAQQYGLARGAQTAFGIDQGMTGGLLRSFGYMGAGGREGAGQEVANMLGSAIADGLDGSELVEHMQRQSALLKQQLELGQRSFDMSPMLAMQSRLSQVVDPFMASKITTDFAQAGARIGMSGAGSQEELLLAQAMGFEGGAEDYMSTMLRMQNPAEVIQALPQVLSRVQRGGMSGDAQTFFTQRLLKSFGVNVHADTARQLVGLQGVGGGPASATDIQDIIAAGQEAPGAGFLAGEAGMERRRIGAGYKAAEQVRNLESTMISLANSVQNVVGPVLTDLTGLIADLGKAGEHASKDLRNDLYGPGSGAGGAKKKKESP